MEDSEPPERGTGNREGPAPGQGRGRPGPDPALVARASELRAAGNSDRAVAAELGVSHKSVGRWLAGEERGPAPDGRFRPRAGAGPAEVARLRDQPVTRKRSWREIGAELGVSHETARRRYASKEAAAGDLAGHAAEDDLGSPAAE